MRRVLLVAAVLTVSLGRAQAASTHQLFDGRLRVVIPDGYELHQGTKGDTGAVFVRTGDCARTLAKALPEADFDDLFLDMWFKEGICRYIRIGLFTIVPPGSRTPDSKRPSGVIEAPNDSSPKQVHDLMAKAFATRWGKYSFSTFDDKTGIGRHVNPAGAFVFKATRKIDGTLVVIEAMDLVEELVSEKGTGNLQTMSDEQLWQYFKKAANDDDVTFVLEGAQLLKSQ